ncbi:MAG: aldehyde-activating protein [Myxococcaceae bacterium]|nr:aldehyde-activating protein [Myxococcaceae bacterium]
MSKPDRAQTEVPRVRPYRGGCQCGAVHYEVRLDLAHPSDPSCSVWEYRVEPSAFKLLVGEESLSGYQFFAESVHHFFCTRCGVRVFSHRLTDESSDSYAVDVRNLHSRRAPSVGWLHVGRQPTLRLD